MNKPNCCGEVIVNSANNKDFYYCRGCKQEIQEDDGISDGISDDFMKASVIAWSNALQEMVVDFYAVDDISIDPAVTPQNHSPAYRMEVVTQLLLEGFINKGDIELILNYGQIHKKSTTCKSQNLCENQR